MALQSVHDLSCGTVPKNPNVVVRARQHVRGVHGDCEDLVAMATFKHADRCTRGSIPHLHITFAARACQQLCVVHCHGPDPTIVSVQIQSEDNLAGGVIPQQRRAVGS